jgi:opacity protein-like surface antigen
MKNFTIAIALAFASVGAAQAQDTSQYGVPATMPQSAAPQGAAPQNAAPQYAAPQKVAQQSKVRPVIGAGLTFGGDKLATAEYQNGGSIDIHAGSMVTFYAGADFRVTDAFSLQATIGYHVDNASATNGDIRFERMPIELLAYGHIGQQWRVGGGARYVSNPKLKSSGAADIGDYSFDNAVGGVIEAEYMVMPRLGVKMRYVSEKFKLSGSSEKIDGSHVGFLANYYF